MINKKRHHLSIETRLDTQRDYPSKAGTNNSDPSRQFTTDTVISSGYIICMVFAYLRYDKKYFKLKIRLGASKMGKELRKSNEEITIIGIVKEFEDNWKSYRVGIATENGSYMVRMNEEGKNLQYEVSNKVEATGIITRAKDGCRRIEVTGYEVYEMDEDDLEEFGDDPEYYFSKGY